jgi:Sulfotransferase domain
MRERPAPALPLRVLVVGPPRSGTTWVAQALRHGDRCHYVHEPDNEQYAPLAIGAKAGLGRFPVLDPDDQAPGYEQLWARAMHAGRPRPYITDQVARMLLRSTPGPDREPRPGGEPLPWRLRVASRLAARDAEYAPEAAVIKSVHCPLSIEWIAARWRPVVVVILRNPLNVLASYQDLAMRDQDRRLDREPSVPERLASMGLHPLPDSSSTLARAAWQLGVLMSSLLDAAGRQGWSVSWHEDLCDDPPARFRTLARSSGLGWHASGDAYLRSSDRPGAGFSVQRIAAREGARWTRTLERAQVDEIGAVLAGFPGLEPLMGGWGLGPQGSPDPRDRTEPRSTA